MKKSTQMTCSLNEKLSMEMNHENKRNSQSRLFNQKNPRFQQKKNLQKKKTVCSPKKTTTKSK